MAQERIDVSRLVGSPGNARIRETLVDVLALAFLENPLNRVLHTGGVKARLRANRAGLRSLLLDRTDETTTWVASHQGRVVGGLVALAWPRSLGQTRPSLRRQLECLFHQGPRALLGWGHLNGQMQGLRPTQASRTIAVLGVDPAMWGMGFGSELLAAEIGSQAEAGLPVYLESDRPQSIRFYRDRGFEEVGRAVAFGIDCVGLIWQPGASD